MRNLYVCYIWVCYWWWNYEHMGVSHNRRYIGIWALLHVHHTSHKYSLTHTHTSNIYMSLYICTISTYNTYNITYRYVFQYEINVSAYCVYTVHTLGVRVSRNLYPLNVCFWKGAKSENNSFIRFKIICINVPWGWIKHLNRDNLLAFDPSCVKLIIFCANLLRINFG